jgi:RimJ/RimL family protein N-acetyltransferase
VLTADGLSLRPWDPDDDADVLAALDIYRRDEVSRWLGRHPAPWADADAAHARLLRWQSTARENPGLGIWAIVPTGEQRPVGSALLVRLPDGEGHLTDDVEVGWHLHPDAWGRGYATRAARRLLEHGRDSLGLDTVHAVAYEGNDASVAVMRRLGMQAHGETDRWYGVRLQWWSIDLA